MLLAGSGFVALAGVLTLVAVVRAEVGQQRLWQQTRARVVDLEIALGRLTAMSGHEPATMVTRVREALQAVDGAPVVARGVRELVVRVDALLTQYERETSGTAVVGPSQRLLTARELAATARAEIDQEIGQRLEVVSGRLLGSLISCVSAVLLLGLAWVVRPPEPIAMPRDPEDDLTQLLATAVRGTEEGILISDTGEGGAEPTIVFANQAFVDMAGHAQEELVGQPLRELRETCLKEREFALLEHSYSDSRSATVETVRWREDGSKVLCEWHISPVRSEGGRVTHFISVLRDITRLREHEEAQRRSHQELLEAHQRLQENQRQLIQSEKMASLGQLAAGVAHEINNPVGYVMSNLETLRDDVHSIKEGLDTASAVPGGIAERLDEAEEMLSESYAGLVQVKDIVQGLKNFARPDDAALEQADINREIESALKIAWNELKHRCRVTKRLAELPPLLCRPGQLNQVFTNLLVNAAQAISGQGEITIETQVDGGDIVVRVIDSGEGIPPEHLPDLFNPFFTTKPAGTGTGLGLAVSYGIVQNHRGTIEVESELGRGAAFTVRLPLDDGDPETAQGTPQGPSHSSSQQC